MKIYWPSLIMAIICTAFIWWAFGWKAAAALTLIQIWIDTIKWNNDSGNEV